MNLDLIARKLKISPMTVSRALNGKGPVKDETRELVLKAAKDAGYSPRGRKGLSRIAFVIDSIESENYFSRLCMDIMGRLSDEKYICHVISEKEKVKFVETVKKSGIVVFCSVTSGREVANVRKLNPEIKVITMFSNGLGDISVDPDDYMGGRIAAEHFHLLGHRHIAVCTDWNQPNHIERYKSFLGEFLTFAPDGKVELIKFDSSGDLELPCKNALADFFRKHKKLPTALFCTNCHIAATAFNFIRNEEIKIPDEMGLLGYDENSIYDTLARGVSRIVFDPYSVSRSVFSYISGMESFEGNAPLRSLVAVELKDLKSVKKLK